MTGQELHQLIFDKWGFSYDVQVLKIKDRIYFQVMWKYLQQTSFPLTESEYYAHLDQVATYLNGWGVVSQVKTGILESKSKPRLGKAISIHLDLGDRVSEWILE